MDRDNLLVAVSILILIVFQVYSALATDDRALLGLAFPLVALLVFFLIVVYALGKAEARLTASLDRRLPALEHIGNRDDVEGELTRMAADADDWIVATGGRARKDAYLEAIEQRLTGGEIVHWRILYGESITHELCVHLRRVIALSDASVVSVPNREYGNFLITEKGFLMVPPFPGTGRLMGIKSLNSKVAQDLHNWLMLLQPGAMRKSSHCVNCVVHLDTNSSNKMLDSTEPSMGLLSSGKSRTIGQGEHVS